MSRIDPEHIAILVSAGLFDILTLTAMFKSLDSCTTVSLLLGR